MTPPGGFPPGALGQVPVMAGSLDPGSLQSVFVHGGQKGTPFLCSGMRRLRTPALAGRTPAWPSSCTPIPGLPSRSRMALRGVPSALTDPACFCAGLPPAASVHVPGCSVFGIVESPSSKRKLDVTEGGSPGGTQRTRPRPACTWCRSARGTGNPHAPSRMTLGHHRESGKCLTRDRGIYQAHER